MCSKSPTQPFAMGNVDLDSEDEPVPAVAHVAPEKDMALDGSHGLHAVSELRVEMAEETQMALLVVEPEDTIAQEPMEIDYDDEVLQIGQLGYGVGKKKKKKKQRVWLYSTESNSPGLWQK